MTTFNSNQRFSIRKVNIGVASVLLGLVVFCAGPTVQADDFLVDEPAIVLEEATTDTEVIMEEAVVSESTAELVPAPVGETVTSSAIIIRDEKIEVVTDEAEAEVDNPVPTVVEDSQTSLADEPEIAPEDFEKGPTDLVSEEQMSRQEFTTRSSQLPTSGTYRFTSSAGVKGEAKIASPDLAVYQAGQSVNYDRTLESDGHRWISYIAYSGLRRYVAVEKLSSVNNLTGSVTSTNVVSAQLAHRGIELSISTNKVKNLSSVRYAVWSNQNGQDDLHWYHADRAGRAVAKYENHLGYGTYHIHTYSNETGKMVFIDKITLNIAKPHMTSTVTKVNDSTFTIELKVPHYIRDVKIPVWSDKNGQDDIKWYQAEHQGNSTYKITVTAQNHKSDLGFYHAHAYGNSLLEKKKQVGLGVTKGFTVNRIVSNPLTSPNARPAYEGNRYPVGQCTWGVKQVANWVNHWGHANQWADNAQKDGFRVGTVPAKGAVIVMQHGASWGDGYTYGHVGYVQDINLDGTLVILESNFNNRTYVANHRGSYRYTGTEYGGWVKFIYPPA